MQNKHQHLKFIQDIVTRMANNSFLLKTWTVTLVAALLAFASRITPDSMPGIAWVVGVGVLMIIISMWCLDGYFLSQERLFRDLYNHVIKLDESKIDFSMNIGPYIKDQKNKQCTCVKSKTLVQFYLPFVVLVLTFWVVLIWRYVCSYVCS